MANADISADQFRRACGLWATGVSIVTTIDADRCPYGLTMNAVTSLSLTPPMFLICVDNDSDTLAPMLDSWVFCVNVLEADQQELSDRFSKKGGNKFAGVDFRPGQSGAPVLAGALLSVECEVTDVAAGGDHQIFSGAAVNLVMNESAEAAPLLYFAGHYSSLSTD